MAYKRITLPHPSRMRAAANKLDMATGNAVRIAMVKTAEFGLGAVRRTTRQTSPKPIAHGTYDQAWEIKKTKTGAVLGNSARHSIFVEVGRRPGKMPPLEPILEWVKIKRFKFDKQGKVVKKGQGKKRKGSAKKKSPGQRAADKAQRDLAAKYGPTGSGGGPQAPKKPKGAKKPSKAALRKAEHQEAFAWMVARAIGKRGTQGRYVLLRTMPRIQKYAKREINRQLGKALKKLTP